MYRIVTYNRAKRISLSLVTKGKHSRVDTHRNIIVWAAYINQNDLLFQLVVHKQRIYTTSFIYNIYGFKEYSTI